VAPETPDAREMEQKKALENQQATNTQFQAPASKTVQPVDFLKPFPHFTYWQARE